MRISDDTAGRIVHLVSTAVEGVLERARALIAGYDAELGREIPAGTEIFDAHVHLGNDIDGFSGVYEDLERINDRYGIRRCFVFCMDEPDRHPAFRAANDRTLEHAKRAGGRLIPFVRLGLALNATADRDGNVEERERIRELLEAARDLWRTLPELEDEAEQRIVSRTTFRLVHLADILAVTSDGA